MNAGRTIAGSLISPAASPRLDLGDRLDDQRPRHPQAGALHRLAERLAVLGAVDRVVVGADQLDPEALERAVVVQRLREVERRLAAERRQQRVGALALDDPARRTPGSSGST